MKKNLLSLFAFGSMLFASSCSQEEVISQSTGNEVKVTFTTEFRNDVKSRAVGEDTECIDQLIFAVYNEKGENLEALNQTLDKSKFSVHPKHPEKKVATIDVVLVKGQTYSFAFWAQDKDYTAYQFDPSTAEVTINYDQFANQRNADAFFMGIEDYTVTGTFKKDVTLKRPFAQVNFLTTEGDLEDAATADFIPTDSKILVKNVAKKLNVLDGSVSGKDDAEVTFDYSELLKTESGKLEKTNIPAVEEDLMYLATAYFLPQEPATATTITASMSVKGIGANNNVKAPIELIAPDITAQRNYRTNIYGNLLTSNGKFNVIIDPNEDGNYDVKSTEFTETYESLADALDTNKGTKEALTYNVESSTSGTSGDVAITIPAGTLATSLTFNFDNSIAGANITISNEDTNTTFENPVVIEVPVGVDLGKITVNLPSAHVTLQQGNYTEVIASTSNTTLVVEGTVIDELTVNQGNVRIAEGGVVGSIINETGTTLYIIDAGGTYPEELPDNTIVIYEDAEHTFVLNNKYSADNMQDLFAYAKILGIKERTITFTQNAAATVTILQEVGVNVEIDGCGYEFDGTFYLQGGNQGAESPETLTFKNINFVHENGAIDFISADDAKTVGIRYAHNVTVDNCTFTGNDSGEVVGMRYRQTYNMVVKNTTFTKMHSLMWASGAAGYDKQTILLDNVKVTDSKSGVAFGTAYDVAVKNSEFEVDGYGIRADGSGAYKLTVENTAIDATQPIIVRKTTGAYSVVLVGDNTLTTAEDYQIVFTNGDDEEAYSAPTGNFSIEGADNFNVYPRDVKNAIDLANLLAGGFNVRLSDNLTFSASDTPNTGYGKAGVQVKQGAILDGQGHTLKVTNAGATWDCAVAATNGIIKNITIAGAMRGIFMPGADGDVYIDNVVFKNVVYTFNSDAGNKNYGVYISNSTLNGWTSHSDVHKEVVYTNCSFGEGSGYKFCRPYGPTTFVGCNFCEGYEVDALGEVVFIDCTLNGEALTPANLSTLVIGNKVSAKVADKVIVWNEMKDVAASRYEGDAFESGYMENALWFNKYIFDREAAIKLEDKTYNAIIVENCSGNFKNNVITINNDNSSVMILENLDFTLAEGVKLIKSVNPTYQVFMSNITINGEKMTQETIAQYLDNVAWYQVVEEI